ncbi:hypothetical protein ACJVDH_00370 [Pedobacter sp. AW1-32]|uniref:hypothetical protein n=1 Tax=Pedobacter sp. AW1-32 TaxID=3383026 RepID=UPI003FEE7C70
MENFNKNSLKAAVAKYGPLHSDGKTEAEVKAELGKDERAFSAEQIDEIYAAIVTPNLFEGGDEQPKHIEGTLQESETPEWVQTILDSNQAVLESNQAVIAALEDLKSFADERSSKTDRPVTTKILIEDEFDEDADYEVAPGKDFADKSDFTKKYSEGDDVTHLGAERLKELLAKGLIVES